MQHKPTRWAVTQNSAGSTPGSILNLTKGGFEQESDGASCSCGFLKDHEFCLGCSQALGRFVLALFAFTL
jgi:hypothetical protein